MNDHFYFTEYFVQMQQFSAIFFENGRFSLVNIISLWGPFLSNPAPNTQNIGRQRRLRHKMRETGSIILHKGSPAACCGLVLIYHKNMNIPCPRCDDCLRIFTLWCNLPRKKAAPFHSRKKLPLFVLFLIIPANAAAAAASVPLRSGAGTHRGPGRGPAAAPPWKGGANPSPSRRSSQTSA